LNYCALNRSPDRGGVILAAAPSGAEYPMAAKAPRRSRPSDKAATSDATQARPTGAGGESLRAHLEIRIWLRLLGCANRIESVLQRRIVNEFGISLARFDLLAQLERAGGMLTMSDASRRMMVTNGAVTGLVDRLAQEGFVAREPHPTDRRTIQVRLTEAGRSRFLAMARQHEGWTVALLAGLETERKEELYASLGALKRQLDAAEAVGPDPSAALREKAARSAG
jgi:DNA-binding MarR family transcriptional regulator